MIIAILVDNSQLDRATRLTRNKGSFVAYVIIKENMYFSDTTHISIGSERARTNFVEHCVVYSLSATTSELS